MDYKLSRRGKFLIINEDGIDTAIAIDRIYLIHPETVDVSCFFEPKQIKNLIKIHYRNRIYYIEASTPEQQKSMFNQLLDLINDDPCMNHKACNKCL
jgi:hypothetical protein